jgi:poly-gamma-glutamate synthesis protein (capsule biosynthesis protein)
MVARLEIGEGRLLRAGLLPLHIGRDAVPRFVAPGSAEHGQVVDYLAAVSAEAGLNGRFRTGADMVELVAA